MGRSLVSIAFGACLAGLFWVLVNEARSERGEQPSGESSKPTEGLSRRELRPLHRDQQRVLERMELIRSLHGLSFKELEDRLKHWENGELKGAWMSFSDLILLAKMTQLDPRKAWLWIDENRSGSVNEKSAKEMKRAVELEWAFQDYEGMVSFLGSRNPDKSVTEFVTLRALGLGAPER